MQETSPGPGIPGLPAPDASSLSSLTNWILAVGGIVLVYLYKLTESRNSAAITDLTKRLEVSEQHYAVCELERVLLKTEQAKLEERVKHLEEAKK